MTVGSLIVLTVLVAAVMLTLGLSENRKGDGPDSRAEKSPKEVEQPAEQAEAPQEHQHHHLHFFHFGHHKHAEEDEAAEERRSESPAITPLHRDISIPVQESPPPHHHSPTQIHLLPSLRAHHNLDVENHFGSAEEQIEAVKEEKHRPRPQIFIGGGPPGGFDPDLDLKDQ